MSTVTQVVIAERREEPGVTRELAQLDGGDGASAPRFLPGIAGVEDLSGGRKVVHLGELDPLDVTDHRDPHASPTSLRHGRTAARPRAKIGLSAEARLPDSG
jgi:hypothetical protein